jgi:hypothetical protein
VATATLSEAPLDAEARKRESGRLRKRFQVLKEKLRTQLGPMWE